MDRPIEVDKQEAAENNIGNEPETEGIAGKDSGSEVPSDRSQWVSSSLVCNFKRACLTTAGLLPNH